jgi:hypothetical protein
MRLSGLASRANHVLDIVRREGVGSLVRKIRGRSGFYGAADEQWRKHKFAIDKVFDSEHGVETGGIQDLFDMRGQGKQQSSARAEPRCLRSGGVRSRLGGTQGGSPPVYLHRSRLG